MTTSTSLNLRAVLKTAIARSGMDVPARVVSGLTPSAKALFVAAAAQALPHGVVLYVVPSDADLEQAVGDVRFFLAALEGLSGSAADRAVLPFPSHEVDPYRGLAPHVGVTSVRARGPSCASRAARPASWSRRRRPLLPRVSAAGALARRIARSSSRDQDIAPTDLGELLVDAGFTREDPADEHGEFASAAASSTSFPPARRSRSGSSSSATRSSRCAPTIPRPSDRSQPIDQLTIVPLRDVLRATIGARDALRLPGARKDSRIIVSERDEVDAHAASSLEQLQHSYEEALGQERSALAHSAADVVRQLGAAVESPLDHATSLAQLGAATRPGPELPHPRPQSAGGRDARQRRRLGRRYPPPPRRRRDDAVRRGDGRPRRTHHRAAQGIRRLRGSRRPRRRRALRRGAGGDRQACRADFGCPTPGCRSTPKPTSSRKSGARRSGAARRRRRFSPICAISRSATSSSTSITASGCSSA